MRIAATVLAGLMLAAPAGAAMACSVTADFVRASNYELVENADAVVVVTADHGIGDGDAPGAVAFRIDEAWKGAPPAEVTMHSARLGRVDPSDPDSIESAHPESFMGPCSRYTFERGKRYVLFLKQGDGNPAWEPDGWYAVASVFGRSSEDYAGPDSLWARAIRTYLEVQRNPDRMAALADLGQRLPALESAVASEDDRKLAADMRDHLSSLSPDKPTAYLLEAYEALSRGESPRFTVRGPEANREGGAADALTDLIFDIRRPAFDIERQKQSILLSLVNGDHPDAAPLFAGLLADRPDPATLGLGIRYLSNNGPIRPAFDLVETEVMRRIGGLADEEAGQLVSDVSRAMTGENHDHEARDELWRFDPHVAARWPETALSLFWDGARRDSGGGGFAAELDVLRLSDYRARPEVTLALAETFDEEVEGWAIAEASRLAPAADWLNRDDPLRLPLRTLAAAYGEDRNAALVRVWCSGESGRIMVTEALAFHGDDLDLDLLSRMLATPGQDEESVDGTRKALSILFGRNASDRRGWFSGDHIYDALKGSFSGVAVEGQMGPVTALECTSA